MQVDLRTLSLINFPDHSLEKAVLEKCFLGSEAIATLVAVLDATDDLKTSITLRNELVNEFRKEQPDNHHAKIERYLGFQSATAKDQRIRDNIEALLAQTNNCIFFSMRLGEHIRRAENSLRRRNGWRYRLPGRKLKAANWSRAEALIPPDEDYADWTSGFVKDRSAIERGALRVRSFFLRGNHD